MVTAFAYIDIGAEYTKENNPPFYPFSLLRFKYKNI